MITHFLLVLNVSTYISTSQTKSVEYVHKKRHRCKRTILRNMMIADRLVDEALTYKIKGD